eukprot:TRINITY_DN13974_c0_g1_i2.p1 TRINITY_DN13974_c0_g1~~TRINITY_DN13974_c0_g1_i2.p1  ORF type:complete len:242 (-),score=21.76 TRINITY_DN13974_c0_g1_i2:33-758(-)
MPSSDTTNSSESSMSFSGQFGDSKSFNHSSHSVSFSDSNDINVFSFFENLVYGDFFFEQIVSKLDFVFNRSSVDLDFIDVGFFVFEVYFIGLGVADKSDYGAVLDDSVFGLFSDFLGLQSLSILGEGFFLGSIPVLVKSSFERFAESLSPKGSQSSQSLDGFDVSDHSDDSHGRSLDNGGCFDCLLFVELRARSLDFSQNVGHSSLETCKSGKMRGLFLVIFGERSDSSLVVSSPSFRQEP